MLVEPKRVEAPVEQATTSRGGVDRPATSGSQPAENTEDKNLMIMASKVNRMHVNEPAKRNAAFYREKRRQRKEAKVAADLWVERPKNTPGSREVGAASSTPKGQRSEGSTPSISGVKQIPKKPKGGQGMSLAERIYKNFPKEVLIEEDILELSSVLITQMKPLKDGCLPGFNESPRLESGAMVLICANIDTNSWLEQTVANCNPWKGKVLEVVDLKKVVNVKKVSRFPPPFDKMKVEEVIVRIYQHDLQLSTQDWRIINARTTRPLGRTVILGLNERDLEELKKRNLKVRLGLGQIQFQFIGTDKKDTAAK